MSRLAFLRGGGRIFASMGTTHILYSEPLLAVLMDLGRAFMNRVYAKALDYHFHCNSLRTQRNALR